ncbi:hypothetical protein IV203_005137 [Nitzschia inconspicua]|uniref:Uncharacterized protein n=1 Tax=Nitzschia inconspicua TaxID=303405 RepID=A0A9K3KLQ2_9STRA|nr:hypothetical protein IV203_005137 [Nitzschia inconspicua]
MMRQRSNNITTSGNSQQSSTSGAGCTHDFSSSDDEEEQRIQASYPPSETEQQLQQHVQQTRHIDACFSRMFAFLRQHVNVPRLWKTFLSGGNAIDQWWVHALTISVAAVLTYSYNNSDSHTNVQIAIMSVIVLVGATPLGATHVLATSIGAFVGGQSIIGATGEDLALDISPPTITSYGWLLLLAITVAWVWRYIVKWKILDGYGGRLGTTTFLGMNLVMCTVWGPLGVVDWNRYYFGFVRDVHVAEEADNPLASAWTWTGQVELALGYVAAVVWLAAISGAVRIWNDRCIQKWHHDKNNNSSDESRSEAPPKPLNNVLIPSVLALSSMLIVNMAQYEHAPGIYNGFAVGAYVGMASLQKIESILHFTSVGLVAAGWGLALTPVFVGFAGKAGFTAMCGHVTHRLILEPMIKNFWIRRRQQQQQREDDEAEERRRSHAISETREKPDGIQRHHDHRDDSDEHERKHPQHPSIEVVNYTKQQRRQQQRLLHRQQQEEIKKQQQAAPLHHRAWVAQSDHWEHPKLDDTAISHDSEEDGKS